MGELRMRKNVNHMVLWAVSGVVGMAVRDFYDFLVNLMGLVKTPIWVIAADVFLRKNELHSPLGTVVGLLADLVIGGMLSVLIGLVIKKERGRNHLLIGWGVGVVAWLLFFGVLLHNLPHTVAEAPEDAMTNIFSFTAHSFFGLTAAWVYVKLVKWTAPGYDWGE
jgi:hypothetical protein